MSPQEAMGGIEGKTLIRTLYPMAMGRITKDELGLPLIARGRMEEEAPVHEKQDRGRRVPTKSRTEEKIGIAIIGIDEDDIVHHHQEECKKIMDDESRGRQQNTSAPSTRSIMTSCGPVFLSCCSTFNSQSPSPFRTTIPPLPLPARTFG
jgi:hypothetical protein